MRQIFFNILFSSRAIKPVIVLSQKVRERRLNETRTANGHAPFGTATGIWRATVIDALATWL
jgi:hypothetical protein